MLLEEVKAAEAEKAAKEKEAKGDDDVAENEEKKEKDSPVRVFLTCFGSTQYWESLGAQPGPPRAAPEPGPPVYAELAKAYTVQDVWREWQDGLGGRPAVRELEEAWGSRWRPGNMVRVQFCRRKVLCLFAISYI